MYSTRHIPLPTPSFPAESCPRHLPVSPRLLVRTPLLVLGQTPSEGTLGPHSLVRPGAPFPTCPGQGWSSPPGQAALPVSSSSLEAETHLPFHQRVPPPSSALSLEE